MIFQIVYLESVVRKDIPSLPRAMRQRIKSAIEQKLTTRPVEFGKPLQHSLQRARRLRVGDWRVIYRIEPPHTVVVTKTGHRKEVYERG